LNSVIENLLNFYKEKMETEKEENYLDEIEEENENNDDNETDDLYEEEVEDDDDFNENDFEQENNDKIELTEDQKNIFENNFIKKIRKIFSFNNNTKFSNYSTEKYKIKKANNLLKKFIDIINEYGLKISSEELLFYYF
jgi:hypothetical protein